MGKNYDEKLLHKNQYYGEYTRQNKTAASENAIKATVLNIFRIKK
jgi:hypothetical protein